jgi:hypothetical protein
MAVSFESGNYLALTNVDDTTLIVAPDVKIYGLGTDGVLMTLAPGESFGAVILRQTELMPDYVTAMAELHARILKQQGTGLMSLNARLSANIGQAPGSAMRSASSCSTGCSYAPRVTDCVTATSTPGTSLDHLDKRS